MSLNAEIATSELLLDLGVSVPLRPLKFLNLKRLRRITLKRPHYGAIVMQAMYYNMIGCKASELKDYDTEQWMQFIAKNGKLCSYIVALCICTGFVTSKFHKLVAWYLRWRVHPVTLGELMLLCVTQVNISPFQTIISSAEALNPLSPRLSQKQNGS